MIAVLIWFLIGGYFGVGLAVAAMADHFNASAEDFIHEKGFRRVRRFTVVMLAWPLLFKRI